MQGLVMLEPKGRGFVMQEPRDPVAYPAYPARPTGARRPVYVVQEKPKNDPPQAA